MICCLEIELDIKGYEVPIPVKSYWDNNWLVLSCRLTEGGRSMCGEFPGFMTMELQRLKMLLEEFQSGALPSVSRNGTEPNFAVYLSQNHLLRIFFYAETDGWEINFHKDATARDIEKLVRFFDRCFCDYIGHLLVDECQDNIKIEKVFTFLEDMAVSEDQEVRNLLQVTVLEYLRSWYLLQSRSEKLMLPETKKIFDCVKSYLKEPAQDTLSYFST